MQQISFTAEWITAFASVITPILVLFLTGVGWAIRNRLERNREQQKLQFEQFREDQSYLRQLEEQLRDSRTEIYEEILEPFIIALAKELPQKYKKLNKPKEVVVNEIMLSTEYKLAAFRLALFGSDEVVSAYNNLMHFFYSNKDISGVNEKTWELMKKLGEFLLAIRRSVGNEATSLDVYAMLEWQITDLRELKNKFEQQS